MTYTSNRRLCALAKGIVRGVAAHYGERILVFDAACTFSGDPHCELVVTSAT